MVGAVTLAGLLVTLIVGMAAPAGAHRLNESYLYFDVLSDGLEGRLEVRVEDLTEVLGLEIPDDEPAAVEAIQGQLGLIHDYASQHVTLRGPDGALWPLSYGDFSYLDTKNGAFVQLAFEVDTLTDSSPQSWEVEFDIFFDELPDNRAFVLIGSYWEGGVFENESDEFALFSPGETVQMIDLDDPSWWKGFRQTVKLGIDHIEIGTDHILFILVLVLPSVLVARGMQWSPAPNFSSSLWRVLKIATMFTIAHSITLTLGGLGVVDLPTKPVEVLIAVSIAAAAAHNLWPKFANREWLIAFGFGLFHGLGFAGLLSDLGLDRTRRFSSLLGFNVGIELGQLAIIILIFPVLFILRRTWIYMWILRLGSVLMAVVAFGWMFERLLERQVFFVEFVDRALKFPRVLVPYAIAAAAAVWFWRRESKQGTLLSLDQKARRRTDDRRCKTDRPGSLTDGR